jgi:hypothetical protein
MCRTVAPPSIITDYGAQRKPSMFGFGPRRNTRPAGRVPRDVYSFCILWGLGVSSIGRTSTPNRVARQTGSSMALLVEQLQSSVRIFRWYCNRPMTRRNADLSMTFDRVSLTVRAGTPISHPHHYSYQRLQYLRAFCQLICVLMFQGIIPVPFVPRWRKIVQTGHNLLWELCKLEL